MSKSTRKTRPGKVSKPSQGFPLFPHASGRWAKKIKGQFVYFGKTADDTQGERALEKWLADKDDLLAGRTPRSKIEGLTVEALANQFLDVKRQRVSGGEMAETTWKDYQQLLVLVVETLGRNTPAADIDPKDWERLRSVFAKKWGAVRLSNSVIYCRGVWKWAYENRLLVTPMRFGTSFRRPSAKTLRANKNARGDRTFQPSQVHVILSVASPNMRAALLLGLNCGFGTGDIAGLPLTALDLVNGWAEFPRSKTAVARRCPLWKETIQAVRDVLTVRPSPRAGCDHLVFVRTGGRGNSCSQLSREFGKAFEAAGVSGKTFYDARRSFQTIAETSKDFPAVSSIMGHIAGSSDMSAIYRQRVDDDRLQAVAAVVHRWLFGSPVPGDGAKADTRPDARQSRQDAPQSTPIQRAMRNCKAAIDAATGETKRCLASVWNRSEFQLAEQGETDTVRRFIQVWGDGQGRAGDDRPRLRIIG